MNTISLRFGKHKSASELNDDNNSCWFFVYINGFEIEAKIIHKGRGKFRIVEDNYRGKYIDNIIDASDVIRCKIRMLW
jgi:hypothetical protein